MQALVIIISLYYLLTRHVKEEKDNERKYNRIVKSTKREEK